MKLIIPLLFCLIGIIPFTHAQKTYFEPPISLNDREFLQRHDIRQIMIDSVIQAYPVPEIPASEIGQIVVCRDFSKRHRQPNTLYVETYAFIWQRYWRFFAAYSEEYRKTVPSPATFNHVTYYINEEPVHKDVANELVKITKKNLIAITVDTAGVKIKIKP